MTDPWKTFLEARAMPRDAAGAATALSDAPVQLVPLHDLGVLEVRGADARRFLQRQLPADLDKVAPTRGIFTGWCSPKGRVIATLHVLQCTEDTFFVVLDAAAATPVRDRMARFVLRSKVELRDRSADFAVFGLLGALPSPGEADDGPWTARQVRSVHWLQVPDAQGQRALAVGAWEHLAGFWDSLPGADASVAPAALWHQRDVLSGIPRVGAAFGERFIPQMLNIDLLGGISFDKGCYPGQEIVARTRYLGQLKRRLHLARVATDPQGEAVPGTAVYAAPEESVEPRTVGEIVGSAAHPDGGAALALVLAIDAAAHDRIHLGREDGPLLSEVRLPVYPLS